MSESIEVIKFGGTSVGNIDSIDRAANIITNTAKKSRLIVILSAMGGLTDRLLSSAKDAVSGNLSPAEVTAQSMIRRHHEVIDKLILKGGNKNSLKRQIEESASEFLAICKSLSVLGEFTNRILDATVARGEKLSAAMMAQILESRGISSKFVDTSKVISMHRKFELISCDLEKSRKNIEHEISPFIAEQIIILPGFIAQDAEGKLMTLGRGGSDYSATIMGQLVNADSVTLYKEVDGMLSADPRFVPNARVVPKMHYREACELAFYGAKILHPKTILPLLQEQIPLVIKNSFNPDFQGTRITSDSQNLSNMPVKALTAISNQSIITIAGNGMMGIPGIAGRAFTALAQEKISVSFISQASSESSICFVVPSAEVKAAINVLNDAFFVEIEHSMIDKIEEQKSQAIVAVVGLGMQGTPGIAARTFSCLAHNGVNITAIAQGSSELNISFTIPDEKMPIALNCLHNEYKLDQLDPIPKKKTQVIGLHFLGLGQISKSLLNQILQQESYFENNYQTKLKILSLSDSTETWYFPDGFGSKHILSIISQKNCGQKLKDILVPDQHITKSNPQKLTPLTEGISEIWLDLTASETLPTLKEAVQHKKHVVLANKKPLACDAHQFREFFAIAKENSTKILYEATVGAGLPILDTIEKLKSSGDQIIEIEGCFSGTLGYIFTLVEDGSSFSSAVKDAYELGYTEPDPREDLTGMDVARKALILARSLGSSANMQDLQIESLFHKALSNDDPKQFLNNLKEMDSHFSSLLQDASQKGMVLRYTAKISQNSVDVGINLLPKHSPLGRLRGKNNQVTIQTKRYFENPLIVTGPGAGAEVTASGVLNDIIAIATHKNGAIID